MSIISVAPEIHTHVIPYRDADGAQPISAFGTDAAEICGAFKPAGHPCWPMYVATAVAQAADRREPNLLPAHLQVPAQQATHQWVQLIAHLYQKGVAR